MTLVVKMRHLISKKLITDLRRRSSILRPSPRDRVATAAETGTASLIWSAVPVKQRKYNIMQTQLAMEI